MKRFTATGLWRYDAIEKQYYEQVYGLRQNFRNLWSVEYQIAFQQGQRRESGFQLHDDPADAFQHVQWFEAGGHDRHLVLLDQRLVFR